MKRTIKTSLLSEVRILPLSPLPHLHILADEEDVFGSDFESTDEEAEAEAAQQTTDTGEMQVRVEERREKKVDFFVFFQLIDLSSNAGCAEPGRESCCCCTRPPKGDFQPGNI